MMNFEELRILKEMIVTSLEGLPISHLEKICENSIRVDSIRSKNRSGAP
jgi:hypothetical protein